MMIDWSMKDFLEVLAYAVAIRVVAPLPLSICKTWGMKQLSPLEKTLCRL